MVMNAKILAAFAMILFSTSVIAQDNSYPKAKVSFDDFKNLVSEVEPHREKRLVDLDTFLKMSNQPGVIILDSRSTFRYERIHVKGAKHLSFTDFTQNNLAEVIPSFETTILIYCNNNFDGNQIDFASKVAMPVTNSGSIITAQFNSQEKPLMMALNIPTYELNELVDINDPRISFEGSIVDSTDALTPLMIEEK